MFQWLLDVCILVSKSLNLECALLFTNPEGRLSLLDVKINDKALHLIGIYVPNEDVLVD